MDVKSDEVIVTTAISGMYHDTEWRASGPETGLDVTGDNVAILDRTADIGGMQLLFYLRGPMPLIFPHRNLI